MNMEFETYRTVCPVPEIEIWKIKNRLMEEKMSDLTDGFLSLKKEVDFLRKRIEEIESSRANSEVETKTQATDIGSLFKDTWENNIFHVENLDAEKMKELLLHSKYWVTEDLSGDCMEVKGRLVDEHYNVYTIIGVFSNTEKREFQEITFSSILDMVRFSYNQNETYFSLHNRMAAMPCGIKFGDTFDEVCRKVGFQSYEQEKEIHVSSGAYGFRLKFSNNALNAYTVYCQGNEKVEN